MTDFNAVDNSEIEAVALSPERAEVFWSRVTKGGDGECWLWVGDRNYGGYGRFSVKGKTRMAHRLAYELAVGPIPCGQQLDHLCRVRNCVNPAHLEPVTGRENTLRGEGPTAQNSRKDVCPQGHPLQGDNLLYSARGERRCAQCRRQQSARWYSEHPRWTCTDCGSTVTDRSQHLKTVKHLERTGSNG